jgi:hypothetical protein
MRGFDYARLYEAIKHALVLTIVFDCELSDFQSVSPSGSCGDRRAILSRLQRYAEAIIKSRRTSIDVDVALLVTKLYVA